MMVHRWETKMTMLGTQVKSCMELLKGLTMEGFLKELIEEDRSTQMDLMAGIKGNYKREGTKRQGTLSLKETQVKIFMGSLTRRFQTRSLRRPRMSTR